MIIIVIKDKNETMVIRISNKEIIAKLRYYKAISRKSYTEIFKELLLDKEVIE